jgi:ABC-type branched-subunit amino acid transport system substrate-binding protein
MLGRPDTGHGTTGRRRRLRPVRNDWEENHEKDARNNAGGDDIKIGFVTTLTTPAAVIGNDMKDAVDLAMEQLGGKMGGKTRRDHLRG